MAKSKDEKAKAPAPALEEPKTPAQDEQPGPVNSAPDAPAPETTAATEASPAPAPETETHDGYASLDVADGGLGRRMERQGGAEAALPPEHQTPPLERIEDLAEANRIPGWQSAALHKFMGWEPGKKVTANVYKAGLARLKNRRIGG
jgi:hypothetical protein